MKASSILVFLAILLAFSGSAYAMGAVEVGAILVASFIGILFFWFIVACAVFAGAIFWVWMFIDCLSREKYDEQNDKLIWVIVMLFASIFGAILYFFIVRRKLKGKSNKKGNRQKN